ncbi:MAG: hypothetical protein ACYCY0_02185 [Acidithiobacillus ferrivorans]
MPKFTEPNPPVKNKQQIFEICKKMGDPAVKTALERGDRELNFYYPQEKVYAWEWLHRCQEDREDDQTDALKKTARYRLLVAIFGKGTRTI